MYRLNPLAPPPPPDDTTVLMVQSLVTRSTVTEKSSNIIPSSVDKTSPNPTYESSTMCPQDDDGTVTVIYEHISKQIGGPLHS